MKQDTINTSIATVSAFSLTYPIDSVRTRRQTYNYYNPKNHISVFKTAEKIFQKESLTGFYKGSLVGLSSRPLFFMIYFPIKNRFDTYCTLSQYAKIMISAGAVSSILNPMFVIQFNMQTGLSFVETIKKINKVGFHHYFSGLPLTLLRNNKLVYEILLTNKLDQKIDNMFVSSFLAKSSSSLITYPIKLGVLLQRTTGQSMSLLIKNIYLHKGFFGFYQGFLLSEISSILFYTVMMGVVSLLK